jgi:hypothetical protein
MKACSAIADAVEQGTPLGDSLDPVIALLGDADANVVGMAQYILQTEAEKQPGGRTIPALRTSLTSDNEAIRRQAAFLLAGYLARQEDGGAVAELIRSSDVVTRLGTLKALADGALPRKQIDLVVAALAHVLTDENTAARKEATWVLYLLESDEKVSIDAALPALESLLDADATQANAAIALSLAWHMSNQGARADALYAKSNGNVQMGVAWGAANAHLERGDVAALKTMFSSEEFSIRRGLGAYLWHARSNRRDISVAGQAFTQLMDENADNPLMQARLFGVQQIIERGPDA